VVIAIKNFMLAPASCRHIRACFIHSKTALYMFIDKFNLNLTELLLFILAIMLSAKNK